MRWQRAALLASVSLLVLQGCGRKEPETIKLKVDLIKDADGKPVGVKIDKSVHESGVVGPGDHIVWECDCPEGTEFAVEDLHFAADLDKLVDLVSQTEGEEEIQQLSQALEPLESSPGAGGERTEAAESGGQEVRQDEEVRRWVHALKSTLAPDQSRALFRDWSPSGFVRAAEPIRSTQVGEITGDGIWKFTWKVRLTGKPDTEQSWDPCLYGHGKDP